MRLPVRGAWAGVVGIAVALAACGGDPLPSRPPCPTAPPTADEAPGILADARSAVVRTNKGEFTIALDPSSAPIATANFVRLARCGFYDGLTFHRVLAGFVIQAGDPQTRDRRDDFEGLGSGGPGFRFTVEFPDAGQSYAPYTVAMANAIEYDATGQIISGRDTNGSQFFIALADLGHLLPYYSIFGTVTGGLDVVNAIAALPVNDPRLGVPLDPAIIESISISAESGVPAASGEGG